MKINEVEEAKAFDPILDLIKEKEQLHELSYGNCGVLAIALDQKFDMDQFIFVTNPAEPDKLYHVAAVKGGKIYDADGVTNLANVRARGFDDDYPEEEPEVESVPADQSEYRYILKGTEPDIEVSNLTEDGRIVKGVNTTPDVQPGETERQAKKLFPMNKNGKPQSLGVSGASPNVAFNLGLVESENKKDILKGMDPKTVKAINNLMIKFPHAKDPLTAIIADIEDSQAISIKNDNANELKNIELSTKVNQLERRLDALEKESKPMGSTPSKFGVTEDEDELTMIQRAEMFAQQAHKDHKRKYTGDPYYVHLDEVRRIVKGAGGSEDMQAAALLHDTVEDTSVTPQDILKEFGSRIARLVVELTDISKPEDGNRATRKAMDRDKLASASAEAQTIKYADLISNGKDIMQNDPKFAKVYMKEKADLLRVMTKGDSRLRSAALAMLPDELKENMSVTGTARRRLEKKKGLEIGSPEWFKHWFDLPYLREQEVNTTNPNTGVQTTVNKKANRITTRSDTGTVVKDRSGNVRSISTPKVGGFQATQTFRPDSTPGYQQATMKNNGMNLDVKGSPETGYTRKVGGKMAGFGVGVKKRYDGSQQNTVDYTLGQGKKVGVTQNIPAPKQKLTMSEGIQKVDVAQLEKFADRLFGKVGIDVEFTRHFMDRVNDIRNQKPITMSELTRLFKQEYKRWGKPIAQMGPDSQAVMKDLQTDINLPFVLKWDDENNELDLIAKTVMRKADFKTPNKEFPVESVPTPITKKQAAMNKQSQAAFLKSKIEPSKMVDRMTMVNKGMQDKVNQTQADANKLSRAAGIDPNLVNKQIKQSFSQTPNPQLKAKFGRQFENVPNTNKPGTMGHMINWAGKNAPDKPKSNVTIARRKQPEPLNWWQKTLQRGRDLFDDEQLDLKKKFEITDELKQLDSIFKKGKHEIRIVGGAVRDLALGKSPKDIDLATDATPQEMQRMFDSAGVKHIPTGIEHGTITAVINNEPYEITTLRADVETDGRRAEVEFVRSWEEDAKRRDLTYNAMSMDFEGNLYDYHGGMDDLQNKVTKFVGDPAERIKEDYLRTLRYFRFQGRLDTPTFDRGTMNAIANNTDGLKQLSVERVWMEMGKILGGGNIQQILNAMQKAGVLDAIGLNYTPNNELMDGGDPIINLARITDDESIGPRWKMSNEEKGKLGFLLAEKGKTHSKDWYTNMMVDGFDRTQLDALARYNNQDDMIQYIKTFKAPEFPVDGNDLIKMGHERGPKIGQTLQALRNQWKAGNFSASKDELLKTMNEAVIPMLYHATYKPFLDSIMKNGLGGSGAQTQWEDSKPGYVYLAKDPEVAISHAEANEEVPDDYIDNIVVLSIDVSQLDSDNLEDDPNVIDDDSTLAYKGIIPTNAFTVAIDEEGPFGVIARKAGHLINKSQYMKAAEYMHKILKRKYKETNGKIRHSLGYYAQMIASQTGMKLNWRELEQEYLNMYGKTMFENLQEDTKMPTVSLKDLYHVGTLDASKKGDFSYEGAGLSVTTEPDAWRRIARGQVAGDTHSVAKANNNFLDSHKLTSQHNEQIKQWAIDNGFLEQQETVTVSWYDDEMDDTLSQTFNSMADAEAEHGEYMDDYDVDVDKGGVVPTAKLKKATGQSRIEATGVLEYVLPLYAESLGLDGVWWADELDVNKLSAPRGVIVPGKVDSFKFNRMNENFADGKKPGRKGLSKRVGIPKGATLAQLEKIAKNSTGERRRMAQWQLNMRRGKNKSK